MRAEALKLHQAGRLARAEAAYQHILTVYPDDGETWHYLAVLCGQGERPAEVIKNSTQAVACGYRTPSLYYNMARALDASGNLAEAADAAEAGLDLGPDDPDLILDLISYLKSDGRDDTILQVLLQQDRDQPNNPTILAELGNSATRLGEKGVAEDAFSRAVEASPNDAHTRLNLATFALMAGEREKAEQAAKQALLLKPDMNEACFLLSQLGTIDADHEWGRRIIDMANSPKGTQNAHLQFSAARIFGQSGNIDRSFEHYARGNLIVRRTFNYDIERDERQMAEIAATIETPCPPVPAGRSRDDKSPIPIFIMGMPRSGSTLLEQILASHSNIATAGELVWLQRYIRQALKQEKLEFPAGINQLGEHVLEDIRERYLSRLRDYQTRKTGARYVIDKLPANFLYLPLITRLFPDAPMIACARNGEDTCWSCYTHLFSGPQHFAYDMVELARYWKAFDRLIRQYKAAGISAFYIARHERLLENPATEIRALLTHCKLPFETGCLTPQAQPLVQTASALQVRQSIQAKTQKETDRYAEHIGPLIRSLNTD